MSGRSGWKRARVEGRLRLATLSIVLGAIAVGACNDDGPSGTDIAPGTLTLSKSTVNFVADAGGANPASDELSVTATGGSVGAIQAVVQYPNELPSGWLTAQLSGAVPPATLTFTVDASGLAWGLYQAAAVVSASEATNRSEIVFVNLDLRCPQAATGKFTVCGTFTDLETDEQVRAALQVVPYDAISFAGGPGAATPLDARSILSDASGRFHVLDADAPTLGTVLLTVDDAGMTDDRVRTGTSFPFSGSIRLVDLSLATTRRSTIQTWTSTAENPFGGATFADSGAVVSIFMAGGERVEGVQALVNGSPGTSFYFADAEASTVLEVDPALTATGLNGTALTVSSDLVPYSGQGGEPAGCEWPSKTADAVPGLIWVLRQVAAVTGSPGDDC